MSEATDNRLLKIVEAIEHLIELRAGITDDIRDRYAEAKAVGYDTGMVRALIARRAMNPADRAEADAMLQVYEAAIGMEPAEAERTIAELRPDAAEIAVNLLAEQVVGLEDPGHAKALVDHVLFLIDLRAEIALLRQQERQRKALAKGEGFEPNQIGVTVRWFEKCAKHGADAMKLGEATFHLYRATVDGAGSASGPVSSDPKLETIFAPKKRDSKAASLVAKLRAEADETRRALGD